MVLLPFFVMPNKKRLSSFRELYVIIVANLEGGKTVNWREWFQGMKWPYTLFWFICALALLWAGGRLYRTQFVLQPAAEKIERLAGVEYAKFQGEALYVKLAPQVSLQTKARQVSEIAENALGRKASLVIVDERDQALEETYGELSLALAQAASRGEFETMRPRWDDIARQEGAQIDVSVGSDAMYVSLKKGKNYLYEIIPREDRASQGAAEQTEREFSLVLKTLGEEGQL
jgi:hypothetical protein